MSEALPVSVIVVSRGRPDALRLCLAGLRQQDHPSFEVIVVADPPGLHAAAETGLAGQIKTVAFDEANISEARNLGIREAAGTICTFIDDDAVPEPSWLGRLAAPFGDRRIAAAGGYVLGRNGISFQWTGRLVDVTGRARRLDVDADAAPWVVPEPPQGQAVKTEGTNMAVRRSVLAALGGFDPAYRFYLDETDLNLRLRMANGVVALVPMAQVHHGYSASDRRRSDRVPISLYEIGASQAVFLRRHAAPGRHAAALEAFRAEQRRRLLRFMLTGALEPRDVRRLMSKLEEGIAEGRARRLVHLAPLPPPTSGFRPVSGTGQAPGRVFAGWRWQRRSLQEAAATAAAEGAIVSVFQFGLLPLRHRVRFHPDGYWEQSGGLWARSVRDGHHPFMPRLTDRVVREMRRLAALRPVDSLIG